MKAQSIVKWFMPTEGRFRKLASRDTQNLQRAAEIFWEIAHDADLEQRRVKAVQMKALEHDGDRVTRQIFEALNSTFITPLDREDIRSLAMDLDDILDDIEGVAQYLVLFELEQSPEALRQFAQILVSMTQEIDRATGLIWDVAHEQRIQASIVRVSELENQADALYATVIADLFKENGRSPVEILKWKEVYDGLEEACDGCKDYTHILGNIVIKNA
jgi:predicted phosphate transport protein (TIGR00153 family)